MQVSLAGIFLARVAARGPHAVPDKVKDVLRQRGPDCQREHSVRISSEQCHSTAAIGREDDLWITFYSTVLSLRGDKVVEQPLTGSEPTCTSGSSSFLCWNGEAWSFAGTRIAGNDSAHVYKTLCHVAQLSHANNRGSLHDAVSEAIAAYTGPFAFAFFDHLSGQLFFGRDFLGRRSLLHKTGTNGELLISSVPDDRSGWIEIDADGIYSIDTKIGLGLQRIPYRSNEGDRADDQYTASTVLQLKPPAIGLDTVPADARLTHRSESVRAIHRLLLQSLRTRLVNIPHRRRHESDTSLPHARLAVLYSGGLDCTLLARLSHDVLDADEPIDLLNVAFENPRSHKKFIEAGQSPYEECPDRKTAISSLAQLQAACPTRAWRLIKVNVPYTEFIEHRDKVIDLIFPHDTEMDLSIAAALYFAARGQGILPDGSHFKTSARVLLSGLGADELFAGYSRHDAAFARAGLSGLQDELALDISRLGKRNLGRDDRVISHWAKEARFPFLDEYLVKWALSAAPWEKCGFGLPPCLDDDGRVMDPAKLVLRCLALRLGLGAASNEKKRAIQFGARTAKMETGRTKGTHSLTSTKQ